MPHIHLHVGDEARNQGDDHGGDGQNDRHPPMVFPGGFDGRIVVDEGQKAGFQFVFRFRGHPGFFLVVVLF